MYRWFAVATMSGAACLAQLPGDTEGRQRRAEWWTSAQIEVVEDSEVSIRRLSVVPGGSDVIFGAFEFDPERSAMGDEYGVSFAIDLGPPDSLELHVPHPVGGPGGLRAVLGTRVALGPVLRPDSLRGSLLLRTRGLMQLTGRVDLELYYSHWNDSMRVTVEPFAQRVDFVRPPRRSP